VVWNILEHFLFFHLLGRIILTDVHIFQRGRYTTNQIISHLVLGSIPTIAGSIRLWWIYPIFLAIFLDVSFPFNPCFWAINQAAVDHQVVSLKPHLLEQVHPQLSSL